MLAPNKTLAAQLYSEFREFFPENAVEYFVSYYDYYQPEAYVPSRDLFIEKDSSINEHIEQMRLSATKCAARAPRRGDRGDRLVHLRHRRSRRLPRHDPAPARERQARRSATSLARLAAMQYERNDIDFRRGTFRVRGDVIDVFPAENSRDGAADRAVRRRDRDADAVRPAHRASSCTAIPRFTVYPSSHYVTPRETTLRAIEAIKAELRERLDVVPEGQGKLVEAQRIEQRTRFDLEMLNELGFCKGIENYSRHLSGRSPGEPPPTLIDYLPPDALMIIDESHVTIGQLGGMYNGDRARKENLVEYGFRLPSALDNRPLKFEEFEKRGAADGVRLGHPGGLRGGAQPAQVVEQVVRPTGLVDPRVEVQAGLDPGRRPAVGDRTAGRRSTSACWSPR